MHLTITQLLLTGSSALAASVPLPKSIFAQSYTDIFNVNSGSPPPSGLAIWEISLQSTLCPANNNNASSAVSLLVSFNDNDSGTYLYPGKWPATSSYTASIFQNSALNNFGAINYLSIHNPTLPTLPPLFLNRSAPIAICSLALYINQVLVYSAPSNSPILIQPNETYSIPLSTLQAEPTWTQSTAICNPPALMDVPTIQNIVAARIGNLLIQRQISQGDLPAPPQNTSINAAYIQQYGILDWQQTTITTASLQYTTVVNSNGITQASNLLQVSIPNPQSMSGNGTLSSQSPNKPTPASVANTANDIIQSIGSVIHDLVKSNSDAQTIQTAQNVANTVANSVALTVNFQLVFDISASCGNGQLTVTIANVQTIVPVDPTGSESSSDANYSDLQALVSSELLNSILQNPLQASFSTNAPICPDIVTNNDGSISLNWPFGFGNMGALCWNA